MGALSVALDHDLDEALVLEGTAREVVSKLQKLRKESGLAITDRIKLTVHTTDAQLRTALNTFGHYIAEEVLAEDLVDSGERIDGVELNIDGADLSVSVETVNA